MSRNLYRFHADGTPRTPRLGTLCAHPNRGGDPMWGHTWCGGWWCTCTCHDTPHLTDDAWPEAEWEAMRAAVLAHRTKENA